MHAGTATPFCSRSFWRALRRAVRIGCWSLTWHRHLNFGTEKSRTAQVQWQRVCDRPSQAQLQRSSSLATSKAHSYSRLGSAPHHADNHLLPCVPYVTDYLGELDRHVRQADRPL